MRGCKTTDASDNLNGKGCAATRAKIDVQADLLAGCGNESLVDVEKRLEKVETLGVMTEENRFDRDVLALTELSEVADMGLKSENGMVGLCNIDRIDTDPGEDLVKSPVEENMVIGHVEVAVIVDPVRFDGHDGGADRRLAERFLERNGRLDKALAHIRHFDTLPAHIATAAAEAA
jgi:hypothetical protein